MVDIYFYFYMFLKLEKPEMDDFERKKNVGSKYVFLSAGGGVDPLNGCVR